MTKAPSAKNIPLIFFRTLSGSEPVREWLKGLPEEERHAIGQDLMRAQWRWPVGMPLCRPMGGGLFEIRTDLATKRTARVLLCLYRVRPAEVTEAARQMAAGGRAMENVLNENTPSLTCALRDSNALRQPDLLGPHVGR